MLIKSFIKPASIAELNYYQNVNAYYKNLNRLGLLYEQLDYTKALPFLLMLVEGVGL